MDTIEIEVRIDRKIDCSVPIADLIEGINELPIKRRWNYIAQIINGVELELSELTDEQKGIIKNYLTKQMSLF